jgi:hypothetical protein
MTPSAVPQTPPVASAPALQCVKTVELSVEQFAAVFGDQRCDSMSSS